MTCEQLQQSLLEGYPCDAQATRHLAMCSACAAIEERLVSLNRAVRGLPAPADSDGARDRFLARLATLKSAGGPLADEPIAARMRIGISARSSGPVHPLRYRWAAAAAVALTLGGATWAYLARHHATGSAVVAQGDTPAPSVAVAPSVGTQSVDTPSVITPAPVGPAVTVAPQSVPQNPPVAAAPDAAQADLLSQLVSHNVELAEIASPEQRLAAYERDAALRHKVQAAALSPSDRTVADTLLGDSAWISEHDDPLATADRFTSVADLLVDRMNAAEGSPDSLSKLGQTYCMVVDRGVFQHLDRVGAGATLNPDRQKKLARILQNHDRLQRRVEALIEKYPNATRQDIRRAVEAARLRNKRKSTGQPGAAAPTAGPVR